MIPASTDTRHSSTWRRELAEAIRKPAELLRALGLADTPLATGIDEGSAFSTLVPVSYLRRMRPRDPNDPLLLQVLARDLESNRAEGYVTDPVGDLAAVTRPGLLQKYTGRALLIATGACAVHCRYCFRRHFPYGEAGAPRTAWSDIVARLGEDPDLREVILSGGDPLVMTDAQLEDLVGALAEVPQLTRLRIHTRLPIVLPSRVDEGLLGLLRGLPWPCALVVHANHAREIDAEVAMAISGLLESGVHVLNQSVLLKEINDSVDALSDLSETLFAAGVLPYYLHQLDPVKGAAHFAVSDQRARELIAALRDRLPGYLVPRLVREAPGAPAKVALA